MTSASHRLIGLTAAATAVLLLSACGGSPSGTITAPEPAESSNVSATLYYVAYNEDYSGARLLTWDGDTVTEIVSGTADIHTSVYLSPSGEYLSWVEMPGANEGELVIHRLTDGTEEVRAEFWIGREQCVTPRWSPGGDDVIVGVEEDWGATVLYNVESGTNSEEFRVPGCNPIPTETGVYYWDREAEDIGYLALGEEPTLTGAGPVAATALDAEIQGVSGVSADGGQACVVVAAQHNDGVRPSREPHCDALISTADGTVLATVTGVPNEQRVFGPDGGHVYRSAGEIQVTGADLAVVTSFIEPPELVHTMLIGYTI